MTKSVFTRLRKTATRFRRSTVSVGKKIATVFGQKDNEPSVHEPEISSPVPNSFVHVAHIPARTADADVASIATSSTRVDPDLDVQLEVCRRQLDATRDALAAAQTAVVDREREVQMLHLQLGRSAGIIVTNRVLLEQKQMLWDNAVKQAKIIRTLRSAGSRCRQQLRGDVVRLTMEAEDAEQKDMEMQEKLSRSREQNAALGTVVLFLFGVLTAVHRGRLGGNVVAADQGGNGGTA